MFHITVRCWLFCSICAQFFFHFGSRNQATIERNHHSTFELRRNRKPLDHLLIIIFFVAIRMRARTNAHTWRHRCRRKHLYFESLRHRLCVNANGNACILCPHHSHIAWRLLNYPKSISGMNEKHVSFEWTHCTPSSIQFIKFPRIAIWLRSKERTPLRKPMWLSSFGCWRWQRRRRVFPVDSSICF